MWRGGCICVDRYMCLHVFTVTVGTYAHVYACKCSKRETFCILRALHISSFSDIVALWPGACHSARKPWGSACCPSWDLQALILGPSMWVCVCVFVSIYVCVCICLCERERLQVHIGTHCVNIKDLFRCLLQLVYALRQGHSTNLGFRIQLEWLSSTPREFF